jgi:chromosome segregation ATPase
MTLLKSWVWVLCFLALAGGAVSGLTPAEREFLVKLQANYQMATERLNSKISGLEINLTESEKLIRKQEETLRELETQGQKLQTLTENLQDSLSWENKKNTLLFWGVVSLGSVALVEGIILIFRK